MRSKVVVGYPDGDDAERASIVAAVMAAEAAVAEAQARAARVFARAAAHAERLTRSKSARERDMVLRSLAAEIACATRLSDRSVQRRIDEADVLVSGFPETVSAWAEGRISQGHVRAVVDAGLPLTGDDRALFDRAAVPVCEAETPAGAKHLLGMLAEELHPRTSTERHRAARETRGVRVAPLPDGMAELIVILPVVLAHAIHDRLTQQARVVKDVRDRARREGAGEDDRGASDAARSGVDGLGVDGPEVDGAAAPDLDARDDRDPRASEERAIIASDDRTLDHIRADVLADMLLTGSPEVDPTAAGDGPGELGAIRAHVQVMVPVRVAAGVSDDPADLVGRSPMDAETARAFVGQASGFDRVLTHPVSAAVLAVDRYTPTSAMTRHLRARDQHCRFPGCRVPAIRCDIDHTHDHAAGGPTATTNLAHLCRRHHSLKHATPWRVRQRRGGVLEWTSPLGRVYRDEPAVVGAPPPRDAVTPARGVRFVSDDDPAPF